MEKLISIGKTVFHWGAQHPFAAGCFAGAAALFITLFVLRILVLIFFRVHKVSEISFPGKNGLITIRSSAVSDLVRSLRSDFPELEFVRVQLLRDGKIPLLRVLTDYRRGSRTFPQIADAFQAAALETLKNTFGIDSVRRVELQMRNTSDKN